jgi:hypothetical protein
VGSLNGFLGESAFIFMTVIHVAPSYLPQNQRTILEEERTAYFHVWRAVNPIFFKAGGRLRRFLKSDSSSIHLLPLSYAYERKKTEDDP